MIFFFFLLIVLIFICFITERKISWLEIYASTFFAEWFRLEVDALFSYKLNYYFYFEGGISWLSAFFVVLYGTVNYLVVNWYPYESNKGTKVLYILSWSVWSIFIEIASVMGGFFNYNEWELVYSILWYPFLIIILLCNISLIRYFKKME